MSGAARGFLSSATPALFIVEVFRYIGSFLRIKKYISQLLKDKCEIVFFVIVVTFASEFTLLNYDLLLVKEAVVKLLFCQNFRLKTKSLTEG